MTINRELADPTGLKPSFTGCFLRAAVTEAA
jgi:hypothetical protein